MSKHNLTRRTVVASTAGLLAGGALLGSATADGQGGHRSADESGSHDATDESTALSDAEVEGLQFMREEEKLAHDVYHVMYRTWGLRVFENIRESEVAHVDAMESLLETYDVADPSLPGIGEFTIDELQALYDELVARGRASEREALLVGGLIEETDIVDIQALIDGTDEPPIERVYGNLKAGSENHLRAFVDVLATRGVDYDPVILDDETYAAIVED